MTSRAYYNENNPDAAHWLRNLIDEGAIAPGDVDERGIERVRVEDLRGYNQCHFFAGIGGWSLALRMAGFPDDRAVWTGSCPCQPFSVAGRREGFEDVRHLWPTWFGLIQKCRPVAIFGEQVTGPDGLAWLDAISVDLEGEEYAVGAADLCAAGVGAPHRRQRIYWAADLAPVPGVRRSRVRDPQDAYARVRLSGGRRSRGGRAGSLHATGAGAVADAAREGLEGYAGHVDDGRQPGRLATREARSVRNVDSWARVSGMVCRDGRARLVPMAYGVPEEMDDGGASDEPATTMEMRRRAVLQGYGNAIVPAVAAEFVGAYLEAIAEFHGEQTEPRRVAAP